ncbi:MAG: dienelactone hydrolase family protein [Bacteroidales bacterium]|nr:dienelactone hydrolase family protein [Bacteroidales bacterium]
MKSIFFTTVFLILSVSGFAQNADFEAAYFTDSFGTVLPYRLLRPEFESLPQKTFPVVLFLHGAGERGSDNEKQLTYMDKIFGSENFMENFPCYVILPQCAENYRWCEVDWTWDKHTMPKEISKYLNAANELLDSIASTSKADKSRLYITGMSMGGFGTWDLISRFPEKFAAAMPICGGADEAQAQKLTQIPIRTFHGTTDKAVKVSRSRNITAAIKKAGGQNIEYQEFPNMGHFIWNKVYSDNKNFEWLFSNVKK